MHELLMNLLTPFLLSLLVALGIGLIVGMEREFDIVSGKEHFAGLRGFAIMSMLGCLVTFLSEKINQNILIATIPGALIFISVFHYSKIKKENFGIVTELSLVLVFFLGVLAGLHYIREALAVAVIATTLLTLKNKFRETVKQITQNELYSFIKLALWGGNKQSKFSDLFTVQLYHALNMSILNQTQIHENILAHFESRRQRGGR